MYYKHVSLAMIFFLRVKNTGPVIQFYRLDQALKILSLINFIVETGTEYLFGKEYIHARQRRRKTVTTRVVAKDSLCGKTLLFHK